MSERWFSKYQVDVPEGVSGDWAVERFAVSPDEAKFASLGAAIAGGGFGRGGLPPGEYTRLMRGRTIVMSDTPDEIRDHMLPVRQSKGHCLINGLGLGVVLRAMLMIGKAEKVTVIERSEDVIQLVGSHYGSQFGDRVEIICADAFDWKPPKGERYGYVWHDIWDDICTDNLPEMHRLHRRYGRRADGQGSWCRSLLERLRRREKRTAFAY